MKLQVTDLDVNNKKVLLRLDLNVPMRDSVITSDARIESSLKTINYLLENNAKVIICSHLGRPKGEVVKSLSLKPVAKHLEQLLNKPVKFSNDTVGENATKQVNKLKAGEVLVLENVRFNKQEKTNDEEFSKKLASLANVYVNDAFATSHRKEASMYGVSKLLPNAIGFLVSKELRNINGALQNAKSPFVAILGGAKIKGKLQVIENLLDKVDVLIIGGGMSHTFTKALGGKIGKSIVDNEQLDYCYKVVKQAVNKGVKLLLPVDQVCNKDINATDKPKVYASSEIPEDYMGLDVGPKTVKLFSKQIKKAKTIVWNGPLGVFENELYAKGTKGVAIATAKSKAFSVVGGGDTVSAIEKFNLENKIDHLSTGGGASLMLFEGKQLPAISIIQDKK